MPDVVYRVVTKYDAETESAKSSVGGLAITFDHLINLMSRAKDVLHSVLDLSSQLEGAHLAIAGLLNATEMPGAKDFQMAMLESSEVIKQLRRDAAALPGTFEDMAEVFQRAIPGGSIAGKSVADIEHMSGQLVAVSKAFGINSEFAGRELAEMMEGRARIAMPLFSKLRQFMGEGVTSESFNKMSGEDRWAAIAKGLSGFQPMIDAYAHTWDAISSTTQSYAEQLIRLGTGGVFNVLKKDLAEINGWYEKHQEQIDKIATDLGEKLGVALEKGFSVAKDAISFIVAHQAVLLKLAEAFAVMKLGGFGGSIAGGLAGGIGGFSTNMGALFSRSVSGLVDAQREALRNNAVSLGSIIRGAGLGVALEQMVGHTSALNSTIMGVEGALSGLPGPIGLVSSALLGLHAGLSWLANWVDKRQVASMKRDNEREDIFSLLRRAQRGVNDGVLSTVANQMQAAHLMDKRGHYDSGDVMAYLSQIGVKTDRAMLNYVALVEKASRYQYGSIPFGPADMTKEQRTQQLLVQSPQLAHLLAPRETNIHIHVEQTIHDADDPDRVYISTRDALRDALTRKQVTSRSMVLR